MNLNVAAISLAALAVAGCVHTPSKDVADDIYERSSQSLAQAPEPAAACIARNARQAGYFAAQQPLYGTTAMAVDVRTFMTGDTLATLSVLGAGAGSNARVTTLRERVRPDRAQFIETLVKGC